MSPMGSLLHSPQWCAQGLPPLPLRRRSPHHSLCGGTSASPKGSESAAQSQALLSHAWAASSLWGSPGLTQAAGGAPQGPQHAQGPAGWTPYRLEVSCRRGGRRAGAHSSKLRRSSSSHTLHPGTDVVSAPQTAQVASEAADAPSPGQAQRGEALTEWQVVPVPVPARYCNVAAVCAPVQGLLGSGGVLRGFSAPTSPLAVAVTSAAVLVGCMLASHIFLAASHAAASLAQVISLLPLRRQQGQLQLQLQLAAEEVQQLPQGQGQGQMKVRWQEATKGQGQQGLGSWPGSALSSAIGATSALFSQGARGAPLASGRSSSRPMRRAPLVVSAAAPGAVFEQEAVEEAPLAGTAHHLSTMERSLKRPGAPPGRQGRARGRTPLVVSAAGLQVVDVEESLQEASSHEAVAAGFQAGPFLSGKEICFRAVLADEPPLPYAPEETPTSSGRGAHQAGVGPTGRLGQAADPTPEEQQLQAMWEKASAEAETREREHAEQLARLEALLHSARREADIAADIARHLLDADDARLDILLHNHPSFGAPRLPGAHPTDEGAGAEGAAAPAAANESASASAPELKEDATEALQARLAEETAQRATVEQQLQAAEQEQQRLRDELQRLRGASSDDDESPPGSSGAREELTQQGGKEQEQAALAPKESLVHAAVARAASDAYLAQLRSNLASAQAALFQERLRAEENERRATELARRLQAAEGEREALRVEGLAKTTRELAAAQALLAQQARANEEMMAALQQLMEQAPVVQAELAEARLELAREREWRTEEGKMLREALYTAREEAAALRVEAVRLEEQMTMELMQDQSQGKEGGRWLSLLREAVLKDSRDRR